MIRSGETAEPQPITRVSTLELFFDLVFVFTLTQVARLVSGAHGGGDLASAALILTIAFWMYGGYAWLTNNVGTDAVPVRLLLLVGTLAYFVMALAIPRAAGEDALTFGLAFTLVTAVHTVLFTRAANSSAAAILRVAPFNFAAAGCTIGSAFLPAGFRWIGWLAAVLIFLTATFVRRERGFRIGAAHFAERHGLVIIVAIGESIVSLGSSSEALSLRPSLLVVIALGFSICAALWWSYFDGDDARAEHALAAIAEDRRPRVAMLAYSYAHLIMIAGIVCIAAGLHDAIAAGGEAIGASHAWVLAAGVTLYLGGNKWFRTSLHVGPSKYRFVTGVLALAAAPLGSAMSSNAEIAVLLAILIAMLILERGQANSTPEDMKQ